MRIYGYMRKKTVRIVSITRSYETSCIYKKHTKNPLNDIVCETEFQILTPST